jgi:hypothetical protein
MVITAITIVLLTSTLAEDEIRTLGKVVFTNVYAVDLGLEVSTTRLLLRVTPAHAGTGTGQRWSPLDARLNWQGLQRR